MPKSDKELAVEIAIAFINANPRTKITKTSTGTEEVVQGITASAVDNCVNHYYDLLQNLGTDSEQDR